MAGLPIRTVAGNHAHPGASAYIHSNPVTFGDLAHFGCDAFLCKHTQRGPTKGFARREKNELDTLIQNRHAQQNEVIAKLKGNRAWMAALADLWEKLKDWQWTGR
ncbi:hypothetical protein FSARC_2963 [Fusarium sarcochroum]|uniref:Uncharacterized protein n=1 Tax=Fusarium sarcochroum TaxID=1208366 RepID=A0A8H4U4W5_9HYPO|nr:hypothetical protein FSARC_2963 [Fusarium sarcochroum]